jgi:hypothetical protein
MTENLGDEELAARQLSVVNPLQLALFGVSLKGDSEVLKESGSSKQPTQWEVVFEARFDSHHAAGDIQVHIVQPYFLRAPDSIRDLADA